MLVYIVKTDEDIEGFLSREKAEDLYYKLVLEALEEADVWDESEVDDDFSQAEIDSRTREVLDFVYDYWCSESLDPAVIELFHVDVNEEE